jgi:hypothetical protein
MRGKKTAEMTGLMHFYLQNATRGGKLTAMHVFRQWGTEAAQGAEWKVGERLTLRLECLLINGNTHLSYRNSSTTLHA